MVPDVKMKLQEGYFTKKALGENSPLNWTRSVFSTPQSDFQARGGRITKEALHCNSKRLPLHPTGDRPTMHYPHRLPFL